MDRCFEVRWYGYGRGSLDPSLVPSPSSRLPCMDFALPIVHGRLRCSSVLVGSRLTQKKHRVTRSELGSPDPRPATASTAHAARRRPSPARATRPTQGIVHGQSVRSKLSSLRRSASRPSTRKRARDSTISPLSLSLDWRAGASSRVAGGSGPALANVDPEGRVHRAPWSTGARCHTMRPIHACCRDPHQNMLGRRANAPSARLERLYRRPISLISFSAT